MLFTSKNNANSIAVKQADLQLLRGTQQENFSKILQILFSTFLECFRAF